MMKVSDGRELPLLDDKVNNWQPAGAEHNWQDSVVLVWWDAENKVGGFHRIGHEPNYKDGPKIALWNHLCSPDGNYRKNEYMDLRDADRLDNGGFGAGDTCRYEFLEGHHVWTIADGDVSARLSHSDFHASVECYPKDSTVSEEFANVHADIPGLVTGDLSIGGKSYQVKGLSFRDRGWGRREWESLLAHRWVAGTFGEEFSFLALSWYSSEEDIASFGWVVRGDTVTYAKRVDILTHVEVDGMVNRGGSVRFELTTGEVFDIECHRAAEKAFISTHHGVCCVDTLCEISCGDMRGFCDFESTANIQCGKRMPTTFVNGVCHDGYQAIEKP